MRDRGEKIVRLAQELLNSNFEIGELASIRTNQPKMSFKALYLATLLTAFGTNVLTNWALEMNRPINSYEKTELDAIMFYAARTKGINEATLRKDVFEKFAVTSAAALTSQEYQNVRLYLLTHVL